MSPQKDSYNFITNFYDLILGPLLKSIRSKVIDVSKIKKGAYVLEVACGTGEQALLFARKGAIVTGLDFSKPMLKVARQKNKCYEKTLNFVYGDATKLQFADNQFDISTITLALHGMDPSIPMRVINQMIRVTKKNGKIIIVDYTPHNSKNVWTLLCRYAIWLVERIAGGDHYRNYRHFMKNGGLQELIINVPLKLRTQRTTYCGNLSIYNLSIKNKSRL